MDNQAPGLNFPLVQHGPIQLDVNNIEILSGASSALYGWGLNGTMVMTGKDPFKYQGLSFLITQELTMLTTKANDPVKASPYYDWTLRWAKRSTANWPLRSTRNTQQRKTGSRQIIRQE
jgi:hypothetical protein